MFRFFGLRKRGRKAVAATRAGETYSEALLAGWVPPPQGAARPRLCGEGYITAAAKT